MKEETKSGTVIELLLIILLVLVVGGVVFSIFNLAYLRYIEGKTAPLYVLIGLITFIGFMTLTLYIKDDIGKKIRLVPKILIIVAISVYLLWLSWQVLCEVYKFLILPFTSNDATLDFELITLKSPLVKAFIIILEIGIIAIIMLHYQKRKKQKANKI